MAKNKINWKEKAEDINFDELKSKSVLSVTDGVTKAAAAFMDFVESKNGQREEITKSSFTDSETIKESEELNINRDELEITTMIDEVKDIEYQETDKPEDSLWFGSLDDDESKKSKSKKQKNNKQSMIKVSEVSFNESFTSPVSPVELDSTHSNGNIWDADNSFTTDNFKVLNQENSFLSSSVEGFKSFKDEEAFELEAISDNENDSDSEGLIFLAEENDTDNNPVADTQIENQVLLTATVGNDSSFQTSDLSTDAEATELGHFESAQIEDIEFIEDSRLDSIIESVLFASDRPVGLGRFKEIFEGTQITTVKIKMALDQMATDLASLNRGVTLEEVTGGWQLRTKVDNQKYLQRSLKNRPFRLSGPALEVLSIVAYKQPIIKSEIDQIRGVESGHLLRALMERGLVQFGAKSELPGRPMFYETTRKFLEVFGLRNLKELPTLSQIDELLPEGIDEIEADRKQGLGQITDSLAQEAGQVYSQGEQELESISQHLEEISTSSEFFEQEKLRQKQIQEAQKAQNLREALLVGETLSTRDKNWLLKYEDSLKSPEDSLNAEVLPETQVAESEGEIQEEMILTSNQIEIELAKEGGVL